MKYKTPDYYEGYFTCPHCGAYSQQSNHALAELLNEEAEYGETEFGLTYCHACNESAIWIENGGTINDGITTKPAYDLIYPLNSDVPLPHDDMPKDIKQIYKEAASIYSLSPKGSAALLRLALQRLMPHLGEKGENINDDIASLVKKGLPEKIQKAADVLRVVGNEAVHPGQIIFDDKNDVAIKLFELLNFIFERMVSEPKEVDKLYNFIPGQKREQIKKRDAKPGDTKKDKGEEDKQP